MNIPFQIGWPQVLLIIIGLVGLWLFITAGVGLLSPRSSMGEDEKERYARTGYLPRRGFRVIRGLSGIVLLALPISLLCTPFLVHTYLAFTGHIKLPHIHA